MLSGQTELVTIKISCFDKVNGENLILIAEGLIFHLKAVIQQTIIYAHIQYH